MCINWLSSPSPEWSRIVRNQKFAFVFFLYLRGQTIEWLIPNRESTVSYDNTRG